MFTFAIANQKGGVGKTTVTLSAAGELGRTGQRVLVIDSDPAEGSTITLAPPDFDAEQQPTLYDVYDSRQSGVAADAIIETGWDNVWLLPGDYQVGAFEQRERGSEQRMRTALKGVTDFDIVLIDCPGSMGPLTDAAMVAADAVIIVTEPGRLAQRTVGAVKDAIKEIQAYYNPGLYLAGVILNNRTGRTAASNVRADQLRETHGVLVWEPMLPHRPAVFGQITEYGAPLDPNASDPNTAETAGMIDQLARRMIQEVSDAQA